MRRRDGLECALKCLLAAHSLDPFNPTLHQQLFRLRHALDKLPKDTLSSKTDEIISLDFKPLFSKEESLPSWNEALLEANKRVPYRLLMLLPARLRSFVRMSR